MRPKRLRLALRMFKGPTAARFGYARQSVPRGTFDDRCTLLGDYDFRRVGVWSR